MAFSKASSVVPLMMAMVFASLALAGSAQELLAPAPAPASGAGLISPSFAAAGVALLVALVFGSALRV